MGSIKKAIDDALGKADAAAIKDRLNLLLLAAKSKLKEYRSQINEGFMNPGEIDRIQVPGIRSIKFVEQYHIAASSTLSETFKDHLDAAFDAFFAIGDKGKSDKNSAKEGIKSLVSGALDGFIGSTEAGELEEKIYFIVPENNAIVRADVALWRYNFSDKSFVDNQDTAIAYILCKSVVDHSKLSLDELIYLASEALSQVNATSKEIEIYETLKGIKYKKDGIAFTKLTEEKRKIKEKDVQLTAADYEADKNGTKIILLPKKYNYFVDASGLPLLKDETKRSTAEYAEDPANWRQALQDTIRISPGIKDIKAYLDELIQVWTELKIAIKADRNS